MIRLASDWIPYELTLPTKVEVVRIAKAVGISRYEVCGRMLAFWGWASNETSDGILRGLEIVDLIDLVGFDAAFWKAVVMVGWLRVRRDGLQIPNAERWITRAAKARLQKNRRQQSWRDGHNDSPDNPPGDADVDARSSTSRDAPVGAEVDASVDTNGASCSSTRGEERREEERRKEREESEVGTSDAPPREFSIPVRNLATHLRDRILAHKPDARLPACFGPRWLDPIRLMLYRDHRDPERIRAVIDWCTTDSFWAANILSPDKLRDKFDRLELDMARQRGRPNPTAPTADPEELVRRVRAADAERLARSQKASTG